MRTKKLIKHFEFIEKNRALITLDSDVRLNPSENRIELVEVSDVYSSSGVVKTWIANPNTVKQWNGFDAIVVHPKNNLGVEITSLSFRLGDGTDEYYWNGAAWEVNVVDWNTEAEIATNISSFAVTEKKIQVIIKLTTTDQDYTPFLSGIKILWSSDIEFQEDIIVRSLIPALRNQIRPISEYPVSLLTTTDTIDMTSSNVSASFPLKTPYNLIGIDSVFNHTDDPNHQIDLFSSFNPSTKVITLSSSVNSGKILWIRFTWEPEVALSTGQDYDEVEKIPAIFISDVNAINEKTSLSYDSVRNKNAGTAVKIHSPRQRDLDITLRLLTNKQSDLQKFADEIRKFFDNNIQLTSIGLDEKYYFHQTSDFDSRTSSNQKEIFGGNFGCRVVSVLFYTKQEENVYIVQDMNLEMSRRL